MAQTAACSSSSSLLLTEPIAIVLTCSSIGRPHNVCLYLWMFVGSSGGLGTSALERGSIGWDVCGSNEIVLSALWCLSTNIPTVDLGGNMNEVEFSSFRTDAGFFYFPVRCMYVGSLDWWWRRGRSLEGEQLAAI